MCSQLWYKIEGRGHCGRESLTAEWLPAASALFPPGLRSTAQSRFAVPNPADGCDRYPAPYKTVNTHMQDSQSSHIRQSTLRNNAEKQR